MTTLTAQESMNTIDKFIREVGATEKLAAEANTEAGSVGGATEHPVKDVDDHTDPADEGFRSKENDEDVKKDEGPASVDEQPIASPEKSAEGKSEGGAAGDPVQSPGSAADDQIQIGTVKEPTGDDPSVETSSVKAEKDDAGGPGGPTAHPASTDNGALDGLKYAEAQLEEMPLEDLAKVASNLNNAILAELAVHDFSNKAAEASGDESGSDDSDEEYSDEPKEAADNVSAQAGWELASLLTGDFDKEAADAMVQDTLADIIKTASDDAGRVNTFLVNYQDELTRQTPVKSANEDMLAAMAGGGAPPEMGGADPAAMEAVQGMGGGEEIAPEEAVAEEAPAEGGGDVAELAAILEELGISPEELAQAMAAEEAGGLGGAPEAGPEAALEAPPEEAAGLEVEAADKEAAAKKGSSSVAVKDYIQELLARSRR